MVDALEAVEFDVTSVIDGDKATLQRAIGDFGRALRTAGRDAIGLFYFAGHGIQFGGVNYLIPIGAPIQDEWDLPIEAVSAGRRDDPDRLRGKRL